jgi:hypothetical protein
MRIFFPDWYIGLPQAYSVGCQLLCPHKLDSIAEVI